VSDEKMRSDYTSQVDGEDISGSVISDGAWVYSWSTGPMAYATKMKVDDYETETPGDEELFDNLNETTEDSVNYFEDDVTYNCWDWDVDASVFTPPSDIEFTDLSAMMLNFEDMLSDPTGDGVLEGFNLDELDIESLMNR
jgi:hypothetical protein